MMNGGILPTSPTHGQLSSHAEMASQDPSSPFPTSPSHSSHPIPSDPCALPISTDPSPINGFSAPSFSPSSDYRLSFLAELAMTSLTVGRDVWEAFLAEAGHQARLVEFCEKKEEGAVLLLHTREDEQHRRLHFAESAIPDLPSSSSSSSSYSSASSAHHPASSAALSSPESLYILKATPSAILRPHQRRAGR